MELVQSSAENVTPVNLLKQYSLDSELKGFMLEIQSARIGAGQLDEVKDFELGDVLGMQDTMYHTFNFRVTGGERTERFELPDRDRFLPRIQEFAKRFGLSGDTEPKNPKSNAVLILGGAANSPLDRTKYAAKLIEVGKIQTDTIVLLGSSRPVTEAERLRADEYANGANDEYELMKNAGKEVFGVEFVEGDEYVGYDGSVPTGFERGWRIAHAQDANGRNIFVLSAPMLTDQFHKDQRRRARANTADTYADFAKVAQFEPNSRVIAVTNAHFVPFQGADAVAELKKYGIDSEVVGYDPSHFGRPPKEPEELLQEIFSAVNSLSKAAKAA